MSHTHDSEGEGHQFGGLTPYEHSLSYRSQLLDAATKIFCAGMSFSGPYNYTPSEAVSHALELIQTVDERIVKCRTPPAG